MYRNFDFRKSCEFVCSSKWKWICVVIYISIYICMNTFWFCTFFLFDVSLYKRKITDFRLFRIYRIFVIVNTHMYVYVNICMYVCIYRTPTFFHHFRVTDEEVKVFFLKGSPILWRLTHKLRNHTLKIFILIQWIHFKTHKFVCFFACSKNKNVFLSVVSS